VTVAPAVTASASQTTRQACVIQDAAVTETLGPSVWFAADVPLEKVADGVGGGDGGGGADLPPPPQATSRIGNPVAVRESVERAKGNLPTQNYRQPRPGQPGPLSGKGPVHCDRTVLCGDLIEFLPLYLDEGSNRFRSEAACRGLQAFTITALAAVGAGSAIYPCALRPRASIPPRKQGGLRRPSRNFWWT
jgi:hypothetical protein